MLRTLSVARRLRCSGAFVALLTGAAAVLGACTDESGSGSGIESAATPEMQITPDAFRFPKLAAGDTAERSVRITNTGSGTLVVAEITGDLDERFELYRYRNDDSENQYVVIKDGENSFQRQEIDPDESMTLVLVYTARDGTSPSGNIHLLTSAREVDIPVEIEKGGAEIAVAPTTLEFGRVAAETTKTMQVEVSNVGQEPLVIRQVLLNGSSDFTVQLGGEDVVQNPAVLEDPDGDGAPGLVRSAKVSFDVVYAPPTDGPDSGELVIISNDSTQPEFVVNLAANGASPCIEVTPETREFPPTLVDRTVTLPVTIESCGEKPLRIEKIELSPDTSEAFTLGELPRFPAALPAIDPEDPRRPSRNIDVSFTPPDQQAYGGTLIIESDDPLTPKIEVPLVGRGILNECPVPAVAQAEFDVLPLDVVRLDGGPSSDPDGQILEYRWVVTERPQGSTAEPVERFANPQRPQDGGIPDDPSSAQAAFFVDLAGDYTIELRVVDNLGTEAPSQTCPEPVALVTIHAEPGEDIHVQLVWDTPGDPNQTDLEGSDVDLHFLHPTGQGWGQAPGDCYYGNAEPDWGVRNDPSDNPSLDIDDVNGAGPENINLDNPEDTSGYGQGYQVGIHYFRAETFLGGGASLGPSDATARIFLGGVLVYEKTRTLQATDHFWHVAQIVWTPGNREVVEIDRYFNRVP